MDVWCFPERKTEMGMIRWMCGVSLKERQRRRLGVEAIGDVMKRGGLRWHGHVGRKDDADYVKAYTRLVVVEGTCRQAEETVAKHC